MKNLPANAGDAGLMPGSGSAGGDGFSIHFHRQDGIGVNDTFQFEYRVFNEDKMTEDLDTA